MHQLKKILVLDLKPQNIVAKPLDKKKGKNKLKTVMSGLKKHLKSKFLGKKESAKAFMKALGEPY